ncbi:MAG: M23 family metallopeptidase [Eubacteriales bacterium]|nr:M23 family metallopeptidase [Eubacteriales bacterium]
MKKTNGAQWWSEEKGFYMILMLCLLAIAVAAYVLFATPASTEEQDPLDGYLYEADESVTASDTIDRVPAMDTTPDTTEEEEAEEPVEEEPAEQTTAAEEEVEAAAALTFTPPMTGEVSRAFSADTLAYDETTGDWRTHEAADYSGNAGDSVCAIASGTVVEVGDDAIYGKYVVLSHAQDMTSRYAGLDEIAVSEGDNVSGGSQIAVLGDPMPLEQEQGVHLHLAVTKGEEAVDPEGLYQNG